MDLLFERMPRLARFMMLGIMCMFIAPFGMLVAKWATLVSFVDTGQVALIVILAFGSAATFMFWAKWLGKLSGIAGEPKNVEMTVHRSEWIAIVLMAVLAVRRLHRPAASAPSFVVEPYVVQRRTAWWARTSRPTTCGSPPSRWPSWSSSCSPGWAARRPRRWTSTWRASAATTQAARSTNSLSGETQATARNWYLEGIFGEKRIAPIGTVMCSLVIIVAFAASAVALPGLF